MFNAQVHPFVGRQQAYRTYTPLRFKECVVLNEGETISAQQLPSSALFASAAEIISAYVLRFSALGVCSAILALIFSLAGLRKAPPSIGLSPIFRSCGARAIARAAVTRWGTVSIAMYAVLWRTNMPRQFVHLARYA